MLKEDVMAVTEDTGTKPFRSSILHMLAFRPPPDLSKNPDFASARNNYLALAAMVCAYYKEDSLLDLKNMKGQTALHEAISASNNCMVKELLEAGASPW
jgi:ankyrin repeat protein